MIFGVCFMRDEADVAAAVIEHHLAQQLDHLLVYDNLSADGTREILDGLASRHWGRVSVIDDPVEGYVQGLKLTAASRRAYDEGADWVVLFDCDELYSGANGETIAEALANCNAEVVRTFGYDYIARRDDDWSDPNPFSRIQWRRDRTQSLPKVAFRASPRALVHPGFHDVDRDGRRLDGVLAMGHFQFRSFEQMKRKVRTGKQALEAGGLAAQHGTHWRRLGALSDEDLEYQWNKLCDEPGLVYDPAPLKTL